MNNSLPDLRNEIIRCERSVWEAVMDNDGPALAELFSDDYLEITLTSPQRALKSDIVSASPLVDDIRAYWMDQEELRQLGADAVLLSYYLVLDGSCQGRPVAPRERWATSIWQRSDHASRGWQCVFFQQTAVKHPDSMSQENAQHTPQSTSILKARQHRITSMTERHLPEVMKLWDGVAGLILTDSDNAADLSNYLSQNLQMSQVALADGRVIGAVLCGHDGRRGYLHHLAVAAMHQGKGIGTALVHACVAQLKVAGIRQCNLFLVEDNEPARRFWRSNGWSEWPNLRLMTKWLET